MRTDSRKGQVLYLNIRPTPIHQIDAIMILLSATWRVISLQLAADVYSQPLSSDRVSAWPARDTRPKRIWTLVSNMLTTSRISHEIPLRKATTYFGRHLLVCIIILDYGQTL
jgi:hypothetical protein